MTLADVENWLYIMKYYDDICWKYISDISLLLFLQIITDEKQKRNKENWKEKSTEEKNCKWDNVE